MVRVTLGGGDEHATSFYVFTRFVYDGHLLYVGVIVIILVLVVIVTVMTLTITFNILRRRTKCIGLVCVMV